MYLSIIAFYGLLGGWLGDGLGNGLGNGLGDCSGNYLGDKSLGDAYNNTYASSSYVSVASFAVACPPHLVKVYDSRAYDSTRQVDVVLPSDPGSDPYQVLGQTSGVKVSRNLRLANLRLHLTDHARKEVQEKVDALLRNKAGLKTKAKRAQLYFPIIERVFDEEEVPEAIKYLAIQESALLGSVVSSSQAVGYWQFKAPTAEEVGLRIDRQVDERMHIAAASRGAARYLKRHYLRFKNWVYAITAYYTGQGGAEKYVRDKYVGSKKMVIGRRTHWYVKTFLAHWIVYEEVLKDMPSADLILETQEIHKKQKLATLARKYDCSEKFLMEHNRWMRKKTAHAGDVLVVPSANKNKKPRLVAKTDPEETAAEKTKALLAKQMLIDVQAVMPDWLLYQITGK